MGGGPIIIIDPVKLARQRRVQRYYNLALIVAGAVVQYLATDPDAKEYLAQLGGAATVGIGLANLFINRLPALLHAVDPKLPPEEP